MAIVTPKICFNPICTGLFRGSQGPGGSFSSLFFPRTAYAKVMKIDTCINQPNTNLMTSKSIWLFQQFLMTSSKVY